MIPHNKYVFLYVVYFIIVISNFNKLDENTYDYLFCLVTALLITRHAIQLLNVASLVDICNFIVPTAEAEMAVTM